MKKVLYLDKGYRYGDTIMCRLIIGDPIDISQALGSNNPRIYLDIRRSCFDLAFKPIRDYYYYLVINLSVKRNGYSRYIVGYSVISMVNSTIFNSSTRFEKKNNLLLNKEINYFDWDWILLTALKDLYTNKHNLLTDIILDYLILTQIESNNKDSIQELKNRYKLRISKYLRIEKKESRN